MIERNVFYVRRNSNNTETEKIINRVKTSKALNEVEQVGKEVSRAKESH